MKEFKTNKYYSNIYLRKELINQMKDYDKEMHERETNVINRTKISGTKLFENRVKKNLISDNEYEKQKIIDNLTKEYLEQMSNNDKFREWLKAKKPE